MLKIFKIKVLLLLKTKQSRVPLLTTSQLCNSGQVTSTQRAWYIRIKYDPVCFAIFKVLCTCVSLDWFRESLGCQAKEAELPSVSGGMPWVGFELGKGRKSCAWNWKRPLRSSIQSVDSVNICKSWMSFYTEPSFSSWADSSGLHRVPIWGFSKEVNFWLAMSASDAGNSSGGKLYVCHSGSSPEALKGMALPCRDLSLLLPQAVQALLALRGRKTERSGQPLTMKNCPTCIPRDFQMSYWSFQASQVKNPVVVKNPPTNAGDPRDTGSIPGLGGSPGGGHGNSLQCSWRIPWTEEPGRLQSIGLQRVDMTEATEHAHMQ